MNIVESFKKIRKFLKLYQLDVGFDRMFPDGWFDEQIQGRDRFILTDHFKYTFISTGKFYFLNARDLHSNVCINISHGGDYVMFDNYIYYYPATFEISCLDIYHNEISYNYNHDRICFSCSRYDTEYLKSYRFRNDFTEFSTSIRQSYPTQLSVPLIAGTELGGESSLLLISPISSIISSMMYI